jgi:hypothetical protein
MQCRICKTKTNFIFKNRLFNKYIVSYFRCNNCELIQTEIPYWLGEVYSDAIADSDTGLVRRNFSLATRIAVILMFCFRPREKYIDIAGGYGMLTRLMRDYGFNFYWEDSFCKNIFAKEYTAKDGGNNFHALTAIEVLEHLDNPVEFIKENLLRYNSNAIIFTTELYRGSAPGLEWWYYSFETGQHISFYTKKTLEEIAKILKLNLYSYKGIHILSKVKLYSFWFYKYFSSPRFAFFYAELIRYRLGSKTVLDSLQALTIKK